MGSVRQRNAGKLNFNNMVVVAGQFLISSISEPGFYYSLGNGSCKISDLH